MNVNTKQINYKFKLLPVDVKYLLDRNVKIEKIEKDTLSQIEQESRDQIDNLSKIGYKIPKIKMGERLDHEDINIPEDLFLHKHKNTKMCPSNIIEVVPVIGCQLNCLYCLSVSNNGLQKKVKIYKDYHNWFRTYLSKNRSTDKKGKLYYLSPKTDIFSPELLEKGITHNIINAFADHVESEKKINNGNCYDMLFIPTKSGSHELEITDSNNQTVLAILRKIPDNVQLCGSITYFNDNPDIREDIEPGASAESNRILFLRKLQENNLLASSAMVEPIFPIYPPTRNFLERLRSEAGINTIALDILSTTTKCLIVINQILGRYDPNEETKMWNYYFKNSVAQKEGGRKCINNKDQLKIYSDIIKKAKAVGINNITYCRSTQIIAKLPSLNYNRIGCMTYLPLDPKVIREARQNQYFSPGKD